MKPKRHILLGLGILMVLATTALAKITTDYDHKADFSKYKTFTWLSHPHTRDPLMKDRITGFINEQLQQRGLRMVESGGDLNIAAHTATKEEHNLETFYNGFGGWRWHPGWGGDTTTIVESYEVGTLVVDIFDSNTKEVIWRSMATETISDKPEKNTKKLQEAVADMFKKYPVKRATTSN